VNKYIEETHTYYINDIIVPGVTEVIQDLSIIDQIPAQILKPRGKRGKNIHRMIQLYLEKRLDEKPLSDEFKRILEQFNIFLSIEGKDFDFSSAILEYIMFHERLKYGGTPDYVFDGIAHIDLKATKIARKTVPLQLAAYDKLWIANGGTKADYEHYELILDQDYYSFTRVNKTKSAKAESWSRFRYFLDHYWKNEEYKQKIKIWKDK
jgi:hypothetical protein